MEKGYPLPKDAYLTFDSNSLVEHINNRLSEEGVVTDHLYPGSYLSTLIDIVALSYNNLIYYLNRTSTESLFAESQKYENINRITKLLGYNPIGYQSSVLSFSCSADTGYDNDSLYTIPMFSYINLGGISYSFNKNVTIYRSLSSEVELLTDFSDNNLLFQGRFIEYPIYTAIGDDNESLVLTQGDNVIIDHFNIFVFVKDATTNNWRQWERTNSLYLESSNNEKYQVRLNENGRYEISFGNDINGKRLNPNDKVAIYYLKSDGKTGEIAANSLASGKLVIFQTTQFLEIFGDINIDNLTILPNSQTANLLFNNRSASTYFSDYESVESIRRNAPSTFRSQYRLVTEIDFESYIKTNFSNLVHDVKTINNAEYLSKYMKYFYDLGISMPNQTSRALFNQIGYADSCNFNNAYIFIVPKVFKEGNTFNSFLNPSIKQLIISSMNSIKLLTSEPIIMDPIFISFGFGLPLTGESPSVDDISNSKLMIEKDSLSRRDSNAIKSDVVKILKDYFSRENIKMGATIDISYLTGEILSINGVKSVYTKRTDDESVKYEGISMIRWNPVYSSDIELINKNKTLDIFQYAYFNNYDKIEKYIEIDNNFKGFEVIEY